MSTSVKKAKKSYMGYDTFLISVLEMSGIPVTGTPSIHSPCFEELFWVEECLLYFINR